jgi:hypothetical protein
MLRMQHDATHAASAVVLVNALVNHPGLKRLTFNWSYDCADDTLVGAALGALVAANAPALQNLNLEAGGMHDAAMGPLIDALASNTHLEEVDLTDNFLSEALVRDQLLPALRANREVDVSVHESAPLAREVNALVMRHMRRRFRRL